MANSGFNQGQTGNATEVGAGVVKLATQTQIDNGDASDGGVPLVATPDKLPRADAFLEAEAGEDILKGQTVIIGDGLDSSVLFQFQDGTGGTATQALGGNWVAQSFTIPVGVRMTAVAFAIQSAQGSSFTIRIRNTPTGADLASGSTTFPSSNGTLGFRTTAISYNFVEGQTYYMVISGSGNLTPLGSNDDNYPDGSAFLSTDGGATFNPHPSISDFYVYAAGVRTSPGKVYLALDNVRLQFAGWANADAAKAETVSINTQNYLVNLFTGLTVGQKYYFSTVTPGAMATSGANLIGIAPTTVDLLRLV